MFDSWTSVGLTVVRGIVAYAALILFLRVSGKRTLAKMNAFDFVVTVALGSTLSTIVVSRQVPLLDGIVAVALLIGLQYIVAWSSVRWPGLEGMVKSDPSVLVYRGEVRQDLLRRQRVSMGEVRAAARSSGISALDDVGAIVLETDGSFSVVRPEDLPPGGDTDIGRAVR